MLPEKSITIPTLTGVLIVLTERIFRGTLSTHAEKFSGCRLPYKFPFSSVTATFNTIDSMFCWANVWAHDKTPRNAISVRRRFASGGTMLHRLIGADHFADAFAVFLFLGHLRGCLLRIAPVVENSYLVNTL